jgi:hypothetical protein
MNENAKEWIEVYGHRIGQLEGAIETSLPWLERAKAQMLYAYAHGAATAVEVREYEAVVDNLKALVKEEK